MEKLTFDEMAKTLFESESHMIALSNHGSVAKIVRGNDGGLWYLLINGEAYVTKQDYESTWDIIESVKRLG